MKNNVAIVFKTGPCENNIYKEGLDLTLTTSLIKEEVGIFFILDGVLFTLENEKLKKINSNFLYNFKVISLYAKKIYLCLDSIVERGLATSRFVFQAKQIPCSKINNLLLNYQIILTF